MFLARKATTGTCDKMAETGELVPNLNFFFFGKAARQKNIKTPGRTYYCGQPFHNGRQKLLLRASKARCRYE